MTTLSPASTSTDYPRVGVSTDGEPMIVATVGYGDVTEEEVIEDAFSNYDCWALALALFDRYEHLTLWALSMESDDGSLGWVHMLVRDERDATGGTFVDITGPKATNDLLLDWDWNPDWEDLDPMSQEEVRLVREEQPRLRPDVSVDTGIAHIIAKGWTPPPLRRN